MSSTIITNNIKYHYTHDTAGNILAVDIDGSGTTYKTYTYGDPVWRDKLTAIKVGSGREVTISYDAIGNPTNWYNGSTYTGLSWTQGRRLASLSKGGTSISYTYDMSGIRSSKTVGGVTHSYLTQSGRVIRESWTQNGTSYVLDFLYDNAGNPYALNYSTNGGSSFTPYYYLTNLQGDVTRIVSASGAVVANYTYDAWGRLLTSSGTLADKNPIRYRGYYYDTDTGFYYLQSRYYDPAIGRFINADQPDLAEAAAYSLADTNLFVYCGNKPISYTDRDGEFAEAVLIGFAAGFIGQYIGDVVGNIASGKTGISILEPTSSIGEYAASGVGGAIAAIPGLNFFGTAAVGALGNIVSDGMKGNIKNVGDLTRSAFIGASANAIGFCVSKGIAVLKAKQIDNMPRNARKLFLRDKLFCNSQTNSNINLKKFKGFDLVTKMKYVERQGWIYRAGIYSTATSTTIPLFIR